MFTKEELTNLLALTNRSQITGQEAVVVAMLQQKIAGLLKDDGKGNTQPNLESDK